MRTHQHRPDPAEPARPGRISPSPATGRPPLGWPRGRSPTQAALMAGRLRVSGNMARLSGRAADLVGLDPVPESVRRQTTY